MPPGSSCIWPTIRWFARRQFKESSRNIGKLGSRLRWRGTPAIGGIRCCSIGQSSAKYLEAPDDQGARVVVNADPERVVYLDVDDAGVILDLDTPADLVKVGLAPPPEGYRK